ncbi:hypothetical protein CCR94_20990 [Rhodoblastus sphagnicola]|uniref:GtrA-like protein domain-containing protein n=1 Tax=Rhodoblastus sphagnicola TaxID=333368 RepID=A0A2S6MX11_9HYPH|nr:hypothetical protein [Rhodoblastus sphagnicola]MBB4199231.1 putative flippase GtrA [Rhodoblastus sphagnicola]PPQ26904.1 hypothetical protein CCR94_20990 [Rhodoblastus sphagnicola]
MRLHRFAIISGLGWLIDMLVMTLLVSGGVSVFIANLTSAGLAISFVFFAAQNRVFIDNGRFLFAKFAAYFLYQAVAVPLASIVIQKLAFVLLAAAPADLFALLHLHDGQKLTFASLAAKVAVTPLTLYSNFLFMGWLVERRVSLL